MDFRKVLSSEIVASQDSPNRRLLKVLGPFSIAAMGIGAAHLRADRHPRRAQCRPGDRALLRAGCRRLRLRGSLYAELSAFLPVSGSRYTYTYAILG
jgi:hypothetical protein